MTVARVSFVLRRLNARFVQSAGDLFADIFHFASNLTPSIFTCTNPEFILGCR